MTKEKNHGASDNAMKRDITYSVLVPISVCESGGLGILLNPWSKHV
jgi:hypothetical protein